MYKISEQLGKNMKRIRAKKKMSQGDIARALDVDRGYISNIENGKKIQPLRQFKNWLMRSAFLLMSY